MLHLPSISSSRVQICYDYRAPDRCDEAGGDVVAVSEQDDGSVALLVADLSAKGPEGEALASWLSNQFFVAAALIPQPGRILEQLNRLTCDAFSDPTRGLFATAFVCRCFPLLRCCTYSSAGAESAILFNDTRPPLYLRTGGLVLGVARDARYDDQAIRVSPEDALVAYTDGVTDSWRHQTLRPLESEGLLEAIYLASEETGTPNSHDVLAAVDRLNGAFYRDDATLAMVRFYQGLPVTPGQAVPLIA